MARNTRIRTWVPVMAKITINLAIMFRDVALKEIRVRSSKH